ncbi:putative DNA topoisomerase transcription factor interactor and regulator CCHC(Zn) family [Helianthus annuus]|nr:putative DNA topoisomerase transcription factor interactor and regulator CCHC(Zn) family [Helianthus annuus]
MISDIRKTLEEEARKCQWLVLWLDCDREGENIAYEVVEVCLNVNSRLNIWRARFSSLIDREIHQAAQQLARPNQLFSEAVDVRQEIDLRIGASFTRFQTMLLKDAFDFNFSTDGRNLILSYGPCQFPTLGFVVERYWEIQAHEPEEFWKIQCSHTTDEGTANFNWMRGHLFDYTCAVLLYEMCVEESTATVTKVKKQEKLKYPPHPLNTIELEKRASRYFRMSSEQTMKIAEDLYQSGFISYPRTETDSFSTRTDLHILVQEQQEHPVWGPYAQRLLDPSSGLWRNPSGGGHDDKAHPPIHPTKFSAGESRWSEDHKKLYELVVRHYLACVSQPAVGAETTVEIDIAGEMFSALGRTIVAVKKLSGSLPIRIMGWVSNPKLHVWTAGCVGGCDDIMRQLIEMSGSGQRNTSSTPARGRGIAAPSRNDSRNNNNNNNNNNNQQQQQQQQATCSFCHQTGHNSSDCYSLTSQNRSARSQRVNSNSGDSPIPCPTCGSLCVLKTANTESNRGRKFYSCQTQGCKFFVSKRLEVE